MKGYVRCIVFKHTNKPFGLMGERQNILVMILSLSTTLSLDNLFDRNNNTHEEWLDSAPGMFKTSISKNIIEPMKWLDWKSNFVGSLNM